MVLLSTLVGAAAFVAGTQAAPSLQKRATGLNAAAQAAGKLYFGTAVDNQDLSDSTYKQVLANTGDFGQITPANAMKWDAIQPSQSSFTYSQGDTIANLAKSNGQKLRCHTLVWHNQLPSWVTGGSWTNATLIAALKNHIQNEVTHYKGQCYAWDVVNEAITDDGVFRLEDPFAKIIGPAFIPIAFAAAAAADSSAKLYYNDYNIENPGAKSTYAQGIVKQIKAYGARIDGVGLQSHFIVGSTPSTATQVTNMNAFVNLGVEVAITELDIRANTPVSSASLAQQSTDYYNTVTACVKVAKCVGVTIWDFTDKYSWVPGVFPGTGAALPWDGNYSKKPAYTGILNAFQAGAGQATTTATTTTTTSAGPTTTAITTTVDTTTTTTSSGPAATTTAPSGSCAALYGQCGGIGFSGPTCCSSGTCKVGNPYYSQCL